MFILALLFICALADLIVGVSNDAVNFLNSAIGSKAASRRIIMIIASAGVILGTTFSSGIMEVARKGIFNPEYFVMHEVMIIFLAVMLTDIILLDLYNSFALPTSTTVSIVFEIFGGAVAISLVKIWGNAGPAADISVMINTASILLIISGIGLSIVFAFIFGAAIQFVTRIMFTFDYEKPFRKYGALYCGIALTAMTYFILVKGAKGSTIIPPEIADLLKAQLWVVLLFSMLFWTLVWQMVIRFTRINVLKIIVLIGTFSLALSFAANDLVNFVGAPLGALSAYQIGEGTPDSDPLTLLMTGLTQPVTANTLILLVAGAVMVITLWFSQKARSVTKTEVNLGRQEEGTERFDSIGLARALVRMGVSVQRMLKWILPSSFQMWIANRLNTSRKSETSSSNEPPAFDLLRAAVNLTVASTLISFATSLKLPLSTTFVTFMVAMSTSLADGAWGRESAVYRVTGVLAVIGGWFITAGLAFSACFVFTLFIYFGEVPAILILVAAGIFLLYRSNRYHKKRQEEENVHLQKEQNDTAAGSATEIGQVALGQHLAEAVRIIDQNYYGIIREERKRLKVNLKRAQIFEQNNDRIISNIFRRAEKEPATLAQKKVIISTLQSISKSISMLSADCFQHVDNNHSVEEIANSNELRNTWTLVKNKMQEITGTLENSLSEQTFMVNENEVKPVVDINAQSKNGKNGKTSQRQRLLLLKMTSEMEKFLQESAKLPGQQLVH